MTPFSHTLNYSAGVLSLLVHLFFALALVFGVTWRTNPVGPAVAYLWEALPPMPESLPAPAPAPLAPTPVPKADVKTEAPKQPPTPKVEEPPKPDIALQDAAARKHREEAERLEEARKQEALRREEEKRREEERLKEEERHRQEEKRAQEEKKAQEEKRRQEVKQRQEEYRRQETERELEEERQELVARRQRQKEAARQQMERELDRQMSDELTTERTQLRLHAEAIARGKMVLDYQARIRLKIRGLLRLPHLPKGNPEVVFRATLLPNGEVNGRPVLVKSSGISAYDSAVERAIVSASPLPMPPDKEAAALFREGLELKFRPYED